MAGEQAPQQRTAAEIEAELEAMGAGLVELPDEEGDAGETVDTSTQQSSEAERIEAELAEMESRASRQGWVPRDQYRGDPKKWVDAKTFVERGERFASNLQQEIASLRQKLEDFEGTKAAFVKFHEETIRRKDEELKEAIANLRVQRSQAQREGEDEQVIAIEDRIELLKEQQKELKAPITPAATPTPAPVPTAQDLQNNPVVQEWIEDGNQWFNDEPKLQSYAIAVGERLLSNGETARGRAFLDKVAAQIRADFPRRFRQQNNGADTLGQAVSGGGNSGRAGASGTQGKTERDLPEEDRKLMNQFIKEGWTTKEKFLASYFSRP